jgi:hypothetical protein
MPIQSQRIQRQETASSQGPTAQERAAYQPTSTPSPGEAEEKPSQDEGFDWISDKQWSALKSFMEGHQDKLAREEAGQEPAGLQMSPEEKAQQEAREQALAELTRRQELARSGRLPRAKVEYVSEKRTPGESSLSTAKEVTQHSPQEEGEVQAEAPAVPSAETSTADTAPETMDISAESPAPMVEPTPKPSAQETPMDSSVPPAEPIPPTAADQTPAPANDKTQRQVDKPTREQQRSIESQESGLVTPASSLEEKPAGETMGEFHPSRPLDSGLDLTTETLVDKFQQVVGESTELAKTKPSSIQREPTRKSPEIEPVESQPVTEIDRQVALESTISPSATPGEQQPPGLGRRLLDMARSLLGREEAAPEPVRPAEELPGRPPIEPQTKVQADSSTGSAGQIVQRRPIQEELAVTSSGAADEESKATSENLQPQESVTEDIVTGQASGQEASKEIPAQIQREDQLELGQDEQTAAVKTGERQVVAEEDSKTETGPASQGEVIARQEQTGEASLTSIDMVGGEPVVQAAEQAPEVITEVEDKLRPPRSRDSSLEPSMKESEDVTDFKAIESADDQTTTQPFPLQDVWPVQELHHPKDLPPSMTRPVETSKPSSTTQRKPAGDDIFADEVHQATKDVTPGKPTDSSIELVTPRKPRPSLPPAPKPSPDVQRKPPESRQPDLVEPIPADDTASKRPEKKPYLVSTEIGDLPSDLWQLLGEKPPKAQEKAPPSMAQAEMTTTAPVVQLMPETNGAPAQISEMPSPLVTQEFPVPGVQRAVRIEEVEAVTESEPGETETTQEPEIDVDQLARDVFPEIKRRLKVEWERGRGRF